MKMKMKIKFNEHVITLDSAYTFSDELYHIMNVLMNILGLESDTAFTVNGRRFNHEDLNRPMSDFSDIFHDGACLDVDVSKNAPFLIPDMKVTFKFISPDKIETREAKYLRTDTTRDFDNIFPTEFKQVKQQFVTFGSDMNENTLSDTASLDQFLGEMVFTVMKRGDDIVINMPQLFPSSNMLQDAFLIAMKGFYSHATLDTGRSHRFTAQSEKSTLVGDALKTSLLKELLKELEDASGQDQLKAAYELIKTDARYKVLQRGQDRTTRFFGLKTDSCKAFQKIYEVMLKKAPVMTPKLSSSNGPG